MKRIAAIAVAVIVVVAVAAVVSSCSKSKSQEGATEMTPASPKATEQPAAGAKATTEEKATEEVGEAEEEKHEEAAEAEGEEKHEEATETKEQSALPPETLKGEEVTLTDDNFDEIIGKKGVVALVDFWAEWCGPCLQQAPIVKEIAEEYKGKVVVGKVNIDENKKLPERFDIQAIPTLIVFKDGEEVDRVVGLHDKAALEALVEKAPGG